MSDHCSIHQQSFHLAMDTPSDLTTSIDQELGGVPSFDARQQRRSRSRRRQFICPSRFILLALCSIYLSSNPSWRSHAFSTPAFSQPSRINEFMSSRNNEQTRRFYMSSVTEPPAAQSNQSASRMTDFQRRMKGLVKRGGGVSNGRRTVGQRSTDKPTNLKTVVTLAEYKEVLDENKGKIVVVRFFATWCKACKAIQPSYYRMASIYPHIIFLEVPVTNENANLHQGLEVPSLPYGHIYYPNAGLVEELKISKKYFHNLVKMVRWYDSGECGLDDYVPPVVDASGGGEK